MVGWDGLDGWDLCVGLLYEHRFAMLKMEKYQVCIPLLSLVCSKNVVIFCHCPASAFWGLFEVFYFPLFATLLGRAGGATTRAKFAPIVWEPKQILLFLHLHTSDFASSWTHLYPPIAPIKSPAYLHTLHKLDSRAVSQFLYLPVWESLQILTATSISWVFWHFRQVQGVVIAIPPSNMVRKSEILPWKPPRRPWLSIS